MIYEKKIDPKVVRKLHEVTMGVMQKKGIKFFSDRACKVFADNGFRVEDNVVYFTEDQVMQALKKVPEHFTLRGRDAKYDVEIGTGKPAFCPAYGPVFVSRNETVSRGTHEDCENFMKLMDTSDVINIMNPYVITPCDVPENTPMYQQACCLKYSSKPTMCITSGYESSLEALRLVKKINQINEGDYVTIGLISALSPLSYDETMVGALFAFAEEGQPVILGCGALPGATSPVSTLGTMVTALGELLSGIVLAQLIHPGLPCIFGNVAAGSDLNYVTPAIGTPEACKIIALSKAMCEFYKIPCRGGGSLCDAKQTDYEAGAESTLVMMSSLAAGLDYIIHCAGILDSFNILGYEKFVLDEQNIKAMQFMLKDPVAEDDIIGIEAIMDVPHSFQYLEQEHTFNYMYDELFLPKISNRGYYEVWKTSENQTIIEKANLAIDKRLANYKFPELTEEQNNLLSKFIDVEYRAE